MPKTQLKLFKGRTFGSTEVRDEFCSILTDIESAGDGCHRFRFGEVDDHSPSEPGEELEVVARWVFTTEFLRSLLEIIPYYLALYEKGASDPPEIEYNERVLRFERRAMQ